MTAINKIFRNAISSRKRIAEESISGCSLVESKRKSKYNRKLRDNRPRDHETSEISKSDETGSEISSRAAETRSGSMTKEDRFKFRKIIREWSSKTSTIEITTVFYGSKEINIRYTTSSSDRKKSASNKKLRADLDQLEKLLKPCVLGEKLKFERIKELPRYTPTTATIGVKVGELDEIHSIVNNNGVLGPAIQLGDETQVLLTGHGREPGGNLYNQTKSIVCQVTGNIKVENIDDEHYVDYATATFLQNSDPTTGNPLMLENLNSPIFINGKQYQLCKQIQEPQEKRQVAKVAERHTNGLIDVGIISHKAVDVNNRTNIRFPTQNIQQTPYMYECIPIKKRQVDGREMGEFHSEGESGLTVGYMEESNDNQKPGVIHPVATLIGIYEEPDDPEVTYSIGVPLSRTIEAIGSEVCIKGELCHSCSNNQQ